MKFLGKKYSCKKITLSLCAFVLISIFTTKISAQSQHRYLKDADNAYLNEDYQAAEEGYRKAVEEKSLAQGNYNLGNSIFRQERFEEAIEKYQSAAESTNDPLLKSAAYHNLGNAHYGVEQYDKSIDAFKKALRANSKDVETKKNLAMAQRQLRVQQQQQQQENQENQEQQENQDQQEQQQQEPQENEEEKEQQEQQQEQDVENQEEKEGEAPPQEDLSKQEAEKLLKIIEQEEQKVQEKLRRKQSAPSKSKKDW